MFMEKISRMCSGVLHRPNLGIFILRVVLGIVFMYHGYMKISNMPQTVGFFATLGFAAFLAYFVAWLEFLGGIALIVGLWTRYIALLLAINMVVALYTVHLAHGFSVGQGGYEYVLVLIGGTLALTFMEHGRFSITKSCLCDDGEQY